MLRIGTANLQPRSAPQWIAFQNRLAEHGYVEDKNFIYDHIQVPNEQPGSKPIATLSQTYNQPQE
jgi:hypothetical protein